MEDKTLAIILFSREAFTFDTELFIECNNIPKNIDILDYFYDENSQNIQILDEKLSKNGNNIKTIKSNSKSNYDVMLHAAQKLNYKNVLYTHHDIFNLSEAGYKDIYKLCSNGGTEKFGLIGFNVYHDVEINEWDSKIKKLATTSRSVLQVGDGYYRNFASSIVNYKKFPLEKAFAVEIPFWVITLVNSQSLINLNYDSKFDFFYALDDLGLEFLKKNIYNICIPWISFAHQQSMAIIAGHSYKSPLSEKAKKLIKESSLEWEKKWEFPYLIYRQFNNNYLNFLQLIFNDLISSTKKYVNVPISRKIITQKKLYKNFSEIMRTFYYHNPKDGPVKIFDLKKI